MSEDREQGREGRNEDARPSGAAARRERRSSARPASRKGRAGGSGSTKPGSARTTESKGRPTPARSGRQGRVSPVRRVGRFLREVVAELRKVIWPRRNELITYTAVVLVFVLIMVGIVFGLDTLMGKVVLMVFGGS